MNFRFKLLRFYGAKCRWYSGRFGCFFAHQFDVPEEVSTRFDADLDMRMNQKSELNAFKVVNEYDDVNLKEFFMTMVS
jgi:16S rRNA (cytosine1402-N4)-methyltransferase